jgi:hypothetical protein
LADVSEVHTASIIRAMLMAAVRTSETSVRAMMMESVRTSETSVNFNVTTRRYIPEDSKLHTRRRENLKSHKCIFFISIKRLKDISKYLQQLVSHSDLT